MNLDWPWALLLVLISPAVGSFLGVVVDRLIREVPVLWAPSSCTDCGARLRWQEMLPIFSALRLRGRCARCGAAFPAYLLRIEIAAFLAALLVVALVPGTAQMWATALVLWCLIALFYCDLEAFRLPDPLTAALFLVAMVYAALTHGVWDGLIGAICGVVAFALTRWAYQMWRGQEGLGLGDVKLMAGIGAAAGWAAIPVVTLIAAVMALGVAAMQGYQSKSLPSGGERLPFGSYLCGAAVIVILI